MEIYEWLIANYQFIATVILVFATLRMARNIRRQTQATNKVAEATNWANQEEFYSQKMIEAQSDNERKRIMALSLLEHIAMSWGNVRITGEIVELFTELAVSDKDDKDTVGFDVHGRNEIWERHSAIYAQSSRPAVDLVAERPSLLNFHISSWKNWMEWKWERMPMYRIRTKDVKRTFELGAQRMAELERSQRLAGHKVIGFDRVWLRKGEDPSSDRFPPLENIAWRKLPRTLRGGEWWRYFAILMGEDDRFCLEVHVKCVFSRSATSGEWLVGVRLSDEGKRIWTWRKDTGTRWTTRYTEMISEVNDGSTAGMRALEKHIHMTYGSSQAKE